VRLVLARGVLRALLSGKRRPLSRLEAPYALHGYEGEFARALLAAHSRYWLFRTNQQGRAGDFIVLDRSASERARSRCFAIELKLSAEVRLGQYGLQLAYCAHVVSWIADQHALTLADAMPVWGDHAGVMQLLQRPRC
jgi:hypothetical protein